jgi:hypothetical protein
MTDLRDGLAYEIHEFLRGHDFVGDSHLKIQLVDACEDLISKNQLTLTNLSKASLPKYFFLNNGTTKDDFIAKLFPYLKKFVTVSAKKIRDTYDEFFEMLKFDLERNHAGQIFNKGQPKEEFGQHLIQAELTGFTHKKGFVYREIPSGAGRIDIIVAEKIEVIVETKLSRNFKGTKQLSDYVANKPASRRGYFVIFDHTKSNAHRNLCDVRNQRFARSARIKVIVVHINPPLPSTQTHKSHNK